MSIPMSMKSEHAACPRCQRPFECRADRIGVCQCSTLALTVDRQQYVNSLYQGCLCVSCLLDLGAEYKQPFQEEKSKS